MEQRDNVLTPEAILAQIKDRIEQEPFQVRPFGGVKLFFQTPPKTVPHRIRDIYNLINAHVKNHEMTAEQCLQAIDEIADNALRNPRAGQKESTKLFYREIKSQIALLNQPIIPSGIQTPFKL